MQSSPRSLTLSDVLVPPSSLARDLGLVVAFSLINAAAAQVSIPLPFTPVPITGQTFAVLLTGALLGSRLGAWSLLLYLAEGAAGLPVFALGRSGLVTLLGPTAGYLIAFPV
ncbi:MAG: biotin transporter BioY, partial [Anaerolineae bacterium]